MPEPQTLRLLADSWTDVAALVRSRYMDVLAANAPAKALTPVFLPVLRRECRRPPTGRADRRCERGQRGVPASVSKVRGNSRARRPCSVRPPPRRARRDPSRTPLTRSTRTTAPPRRRASAPGCPAPEL
ncbi:hypothetical protein ACFT9I_16565 [Streptomyces sp. NPDC057137]|uniref:MmyB family transcriptional regulator n=1 Tax=Streptomyces sp. NPDC057137 TaxID=3346030 RepID=UPI0036414F71